MKKINWRKLRGRSQLSVLAFVLTTLCLFLLNRWTEDLWEKQAVAARNLFRAPPSPTEKTNGNIWQRIAKTKEIFRCSSSTMCSPSWLTTLSNPNHNDDGNRGTASASASCPFYFKWIRHDLKPWSEAGITLDNVEAARKFASFRLMIVQGRLYIESYRKSFQTRDLFTIWAFAQLLKLYPGMLPDLDLMFNGNDRPVINGKHKTPPPPLFRYCGSEDTFDIPFPDWTFWGWPEVHIQPWEGLVEEILNGSRKIKWVDRNPTAYWRGNSQVSNGRQNLLKCSEKPNWNGRLYAQDWNKESKQGFRNSKLSNECKNRYKIYIEGNAWSVSLKYIMACDSLTLLVKPKFYDFFSRGLVPQRHYWPVRDDQMCESIQFTVDWGNNHTNEAMEIGKGGRDFIVNELKMSNVYDYMFHSLKEYANLLKYKPSVTRNAVEYCSETIICFANEEEKEYMKNSMVKTASQSPPCELGKAESDRKAVREFLERKADAMKHVKLLETTKNQTA